MKRIYTLAAVLCAALFVYGCASIIKGTKQDISINSTPSNAKVVVKTKGGIEKFSGTTPCSVKLAKKQEYQVIVTLEGFKEQTIWLDQSFEAWTIGNLLCGGVIGLIVDAANGAMWKLEPDAIQVTMMTASLEDGSEETYAVLQALDTKGEKRLLVVPLIKENKSVPTISDFKL